MTAAETVPEGPDPIVEAARSAYADFRAATGTDGRASAAEAAAGHVPALADEIERLTDILDELTSNAPDIERLLVEHGRMEVVTAEHWGMKAMVTSLLNSLGDAPNYIETPVEITLREEGGGRRVIVTVQRHTGRTPHQLRVEAEAAAAVWKARAERLYRDRYGRRPAGTDWDREDLR